MLIELAFIMMIESSGNPQAFNKNTQATGLYQITPICLEDYNQFHKEHFTMKEMFEPKKCEKVASWYLLIRIPQMLDYYGLQINETNILWAYNSGIGNVKKNIKPLETKNYIIKYQQMKRG